MQILLTKLNKRFNICNNDVFDLFLCGVTSYSLIQLSFLYIDFKFVDVGTEDIYLLMICK